jgi:PAS domain S-box-containing protein
MSDPSTISEHADFDDRLRVRRARIARATSAALDTLGQHVDDTGAPGLVETSRLFETVLADIDAAAEDLRRQNEALFAAGLDMQTSAAFYRELFDLAPVAYLVTDVDGKIVHVNTGACALLARPANGLVGKPLAAYVALDERSAFREALRRCAASTEVEEWPIRLVPSAAEPLECRVRVGALRSASSARPCLAWIVTTAPPDALDL